MSKQVLAIRVDAANPNHHLWNNNGTWFMHYTTYPTPVTKARVRQSLRTKSLNTARRRRDRFLQRFGATAAEDPEAQEGGPMAPRLHIRLA